MQSLAELHQKCFPNNPWSAADFAELKKSGCEIVASENGFIVWRCVAGECEIITIGVTPNARGAGIADALLVCMEREIVKTCTVPVFLEVAENNLPAIKLYERNGYKPVGRRPKYYDGVDAIIMQKVLNS